MTDALESFLLSLMWTWTLFVACDAIASLVRLARLLWRAPK